MRTESVHEIGNKVYLGCTMEGEITAIVIRRESYIQYEISYWSGSDYKTVWLFDHQFQQAGNQSKTGKIGFK